MPSATGLSESTELRLRNQLGRAFRHVFGAEQGLRVLVKLATTQMLESGESRSAIHSALNRLVESHPDSGGAKPSLLSGEPGTTTLKEKMLTWSDRTSLTRDME